MNSASGDEGNAACGDVLLVAHGHILRAFAMRWIGRKLTEGVSLLLEGMFASLRNLRTLRDSATITKMKSWSIEANGGSSGRRRYIEL